MDPRHHGPRGGSGGPGGNVGMPGMPSGMGIPQPPGPPGNGPPPHHLSHSHHHGPPPPTGPHYDDRDRMSAPPGPPVGRLHRPSPPLADPYYPHSHHQQAQPHPAHQQHHQLQLHQQHPQPPHHAQHPPHPPPPHHGSHSVHSIQSQTRHYKEHSRSPESERIPQSYRQQHSQQRNDSLTPLSLTNISPVGPPPTMYSMARASTPDQQHKPPRAPSLTSSPAVYRGPPPPLPPSHPAHHPHPAHAPHQMGPDSMMNPPPHSHHRGMPPPSSPHHNQAPLQPHPHPPQHQSQQQHEQQPRQSQSHSTPPTPYPSGRDLSSLNTAPPPPPPPPPPPSRQTSGMSISAILDKPTHPSPHGGSSGPLKAVPPQLPPSEFNQSKRSYTPDFGHQNGDRGRNVSIGSSPSGMNNQHQPYGPPGGKDRGTPDHSYRPHMPHHPPGMMGNHPHGVPPRPVSQPIAPTTAHSLSSVLHPHQDEGPHRGHGRSTSYHDRERDSLREREQRERREMRDRQEEHRMERERYERERQLKEKHDKELREREMRDRYEKQRDMERERGENLPRDRDLRLQEIRERDMQEMREREMRERDMREREIREMREREMREREMREREAREREIREMREREIREMREREMREMHEREAHEREIQREREEREREREREREMERERERERERELIAQQQQQQQQQHQREQREREQREREARERELQDRERSMQRGDLRDQREREIDREREMEREKLTNVHSMGGPIGPPSPHINHHSHHGPPGYHSHSVTTPGLHTPITSSVPPPHTPLHTPMASNIATIPPQQPLNGPSLQQPQTSSSYPSFGYTTTMPQSPFALQPTLSLPPPPPGDGHDRRRQGYTDNQHGRAEELLYTKQMIERKATAQGEAQAQKNPLLMGGYEMSRAEEGQGGQQGPGPGQGQRRGLIEKEEKGETIVGGRRTKEKIERERETEEESVPPTVAGTGKKRRHHHHHHHHNHHHHAQDDRFSLEGGPLHPQPQSLASINTKRAMTPVPPTVHHHHHPPRLHSPAPAPPAKRPKLIINSTPVLQMVDTYPQYHLGSMVYNASGNTNAMSKGYSTTHTMLPRFEGRENCIFQIRIPRRYLYERGRAEVCRRRWLWGSDVYTDDSDILAVLVHLGKIRPVLPQGVDPEMVLGQHTGVLDEKERDLGRKVGRPVGKGKAVINGTPNLAAPATNGVFPSSPSVTPSSGYLDMNKDIIVDILILPPLEKYSSTVRNAIKSRSWAKQHDGMSYMVREVKTAEPGEAEGRGRSMRKQRLNEREHIRKWGTLPGREGEGRLKTLGREAKVGA